MATATSADAANYPQWEIDLLTAIGAPLTPTNLNALNYWGQSEGTAGSNNPLAVSGKFPNATKCLAQCGTGSPVYAYATEADGVAANASFLTGNGGAYKNVVQAFVKNQGLQAIWAAVNGSGWCKGCQSGKYPSVLYGALGGNAPPISQAGQGAGTSTPANGVGCSSKGKIFGIAGLSFSYCQGKALVGGLLVGAGGVMALTGVLIVVAWGLGHTSAGRGAAQIVRSGGPVGAVTGALR